MVFSLVRFFNQKSDCRVYWKNCFGSSSSSKMSGGPRERSVNVSDAEARQVLGPAGNTDGSVLARKPFSNPSCKAERRTPDLAKKEKKTAILPLRGHSRPSPVSSLRVPLILRNEQFLRSNLSPNASCSSEDSTDSAQSSSSSGKVVITNAMGLQRKKLSVLKLDKNISDNASVSSQDRLGSTKKRCSWVTPNTDPYKLLFMMKNGEFPCMMTRSCLSCWSYLEHWPNLHGQIFLTKDTSSRWCSGILTPPWSPR